MDEARGWSHATRFALAGAAWSLGLFGLLRLNWTETHAVLPFTRAQAAAAGVLVGSPTLPVEVTLACSGADALALCVGAILAYPVAWRTRLTGAIGGAALILGLNTLRIGTLGRAAASPAWFDTLHVYVWPALLTLAIAGYVFGWMRRAARRHPLDGKTVAPLECRSAGRGPAPVAPARLAPLPSRRFVMLTVAFLLVFSAGSSLYLESPSVLALASFVAGAAAATLGVLGVDAHAAANVLLTPRGAFLVTQECIATPLIAVYLAAVCAYSSTWRQLSFGLVVTLPLFFVLGVVRLLVVALPDVVTSPIFFVHAFYQLLLGAIVVFMAARWRHGRAAPGYGLLGGVAGVLFVYFAGPLYTRVVTYPTGPPLDDPQGAIALLPAFQAGLYLALWAAAFVAVGWTRFLAGLAVLGLTQTAGLLALHAFAIHAGLTAQVRGWAVAAPVLVFAAVVTSARPRR